MQHLGRVELDERETAKIFKNCSENQTKKQRLAYLETQLKSQVDLVKKLKDENKSIQQERDEVLEECEDELKAARFNNELVMKENLEIRKEIKILYSTIGSLQMENEKLSDFKLKNRELELAAEQSLKVALQLEETGRILRQNIAQQGVKDGETLIKIAELRKMLKERGDEIEGLSECLLKSNMLYAESETERQNLCQRVKGLIKRKEFNWRFFKFWGSVK